MGLRVSREAGLLGCELLGKATVFCPFRHGDGGDLIAEVEQSFDCVKKSGAVHRDLPRVAMTLPKRGWL